MHSGLSWTMTERSPPSGMWAAAIGAGMVVSTEGILHVLEVGAVQSAEPGVLVQKAEEHRASSRRKERGMGVRPTQ